MHRHTHQNEPRSARQHGARSVRQDDARTARRGGSVAGGLTMLGVFVPTAYLAFKLFEKNNSKLGAKRDKLVRDAGPDNMQTPPRRWDSVDQQADESFPASDPPGNY